MRGVRVGLDVVIQAPTISSSWRPDILGRFCVPKSVKSFIHRNGSRSFLMLATHRQEALFFWHRNVHLCTRDGTYTDYSPDISTLVHSASSIDGVAQPAIGQSYQTKQHTSIVKKETNCGTGSKGARRTLTGKNEPRRQDKQSHL
jgi:hypothetical protein